jgi:hypothetical protein
LATGWDNPSKRGQPGNQAGIGDGHYVAEDMHYAVWYARSLTKCSTIPIASVWKGTMIRKVREMSNGVEHVIWEGHVFLYSMLVKPNTPPMEPTEERFMEWDPEMEDRPAGLKPITRW